MNSCGAIRESVLEIVKEDILRVLGEREEKVSLESLKAEIKVSHSFVSETINSLKEENLIEVEEEFIRLTKNGQDIAKDIIKKHLVLENYFKETRSEREAHQAAHFLEHYVSEEVVDNIKKLSIFKGEGIPLTKFGLKEEGVITDIMFSDYKLFERMVSMGILLGQKIEITNKIPSGVIVKTNNKKFVLDKNIAKEIKVLKLEKS